MQNAKGREERDNKQRLDIDRMKSHLRGPGFLNTRSGMQVREKEANRTRSRYCLDRVSTSGDIDHCGSVLADSVIGKMDNKDSWR